MSKAATQTELATRLEVLEAAEATARRTLAKATARTAEAAQNEANARARLNDLIAEVEAVEKQIAAIEESAVIEASDPIPMPTQRTSEPMPDRFVYLSSGDRTRAAEHLHRLSERIANNHA